jgi:hypothetical protein
MSTTTSEPMTEVAPVVTENRWAMLVHHFRDWYSSVAVDFGWVRGARRENTRCGL